ncbi:cytoplasmic dynein 2 intermediate chain 1 [Coccinella septempunctata]|uniref:cytoplasmic dynein 2 intermediate chain 1 n=1 Tax=Coccinella septempunctata TaxID=41139 RepID=UPI001D061813|nr:cytoplasmic dynein 2 intermediate chain 1 [Coccinella septempunctata]
MSTKTKNIGGRTTTQRIQTKPRGTTSDRKQESVRNVKEKTEEKKPRNDSNKTKTNVSKEDKEKTVAKQTSKRPSVAKPQSIASDRAQSKRIVKTQYFPSKNNYSELLKHLNQHEIGAGDAKNKKVHRESSSDSMSTRERPRTSTLRKGSIVNENIAGPEIPKKPPPAEEEEEYEDDFDSYESDFENVSSSDSTVHNLSEISTESTSSSSGDEDASVEGQPSVSKDPERKLDSGNFELKEDKTKGEFSNLQDLVERDNLKFKRPESNMRSNLTSLSDEGFEEAKSLQFLNFVSAKRRNDRRRSLEMRKKRGEELLNMIKLDTVNFTVFDMPPVPYDQFIKAFGNANSIQIGIQTGEERIEEEAQTDRVETAEKWIQMPPKFSKVTSVYKFDRLGAGPPLDQTPLAEIPSEPQFDEYRLNRFLTNAAGLVLDVLKGGKTQRNGNVAGDSFSRAVVALKPPSEFSGRRKISQIVPNGRNPSTFLSVHVDQDGDGFSKSMVYLWNVNGATPEVYLACHGKIRCCCFGYDAGTVFAGLENGSLVAWDTYHNVSVVRNVCSMLEGDVVLRFPTFLTDIEKSHCCSVVAIQCVSEDSAHQIFDEVESTWKVCSLDQEGTIVIWSIMANLKGDSARRNGGGIKLLKNFEVNLRNVVPDMDDLACNDMFLSNFSKSFIATNYGSILQCDLNKEKTHVKIHRADSTSPVKCLVPCPFSDAYFLAGLENGSVHLYSGKTSEPLMVITNKEGESADESIDEIQWSLEKPCVFYTKNSDNVVDAWDLSRSSVFPIGSLKSEERVTCMRLARCKLDQSYMVTSTEATIHIHFLNQEHERENDEGYMKEMKTFLTYVSRL